MKNTNSTLVISESCEYIEQFSSHLPSNRQYGGDNFAPLLQEYGFHPILTDLFIPQQIFEKR